MSLYDEIFESGLVGASKSDVAFRSNWRASRALKQCAALEAMLPRAKYDRLRQFARHNPRRFVKGFSELAFDVVEHWGDGRPVPQNGSDYMSMVETFFSTLGRNEAQPFVLHLGFLCYDLYRSTGHSDVWVAVLRFFKDVKVHHYLRKQIDDVYQYVMKAAFEIMLELQKLERTHLAGSAVYAEAAADAGPVPQTLDSVFESYSGLKDSALFRKLHKLMTSACAVAFFSKNGMTNLPAKLGYVEAGLNSTSAQSILQQTDFMMCALQTLHWLATMGFQCVLDKNVAPLLANVTSYTDWVSKTQDLLSKADQVSCLEPHVTEPMAHGEAKHQFIGQLNNLIESGEAIVRWMKADEQYERRFVNNLLMDLKRLKSALITRDFAAKSRPQPYAALITGGTSIAKSAFTKMLYYAFCGVAGLPNDDGFMYPRNPAEKHWSNFQSSCHTILYDEVGKQNPRVGGKDETSDEILGVCNTVPMVPIMAAIEDKGKTPVLAELVLATSNTKDLNVKSYYTNPAAILRRFDLIITLTVKPEFAQENGMLSPAAVPRPDGTFPNIWNIKCEVAVPTPAPKGTTEQGFEFKLLASFDNTPDFLRFYALRVAEHRGNQDRAIFASDVMRTIEFCKAPHHVVALPRYMCGCPVAQSRDRPDVRYRTTLIETFSQAVLDTTEFTEYPRQWMFVWLFTFLLRFSFFKWFVSHWFSDAKLIAMAKKSCYDKYTAKRLALTMGLRHSKLFNPPKWVKLIGQCALIAGQAYLIWKGAQWLTSRPVVKPQGAKISASTLDNEVVWYKDDYVTTPADVGKSCVGLKGFTPERLLEVYQNNLITLVFDTGRTTMIDGVEKRLVRNQRAFCLQDRLYVFNNHGIPERDDGRVVCDIVRGPVGPGVSANIQRYEIFPSRLIRMPEKDLAFVWLDVLDSRKSMIGLLGTKELKGSYNGYLLGRDFRGHLQAPNLVRNIQKGDATIPDIGYLSSLWRGVSQTRTVDGDCGSMLIGDSAFGPVLLGIHAAGYVLNNDILVASITREDVEGLVNRFVEKPVEAHEMKIDKPGYERELIDLHKNCPVRFIEEGSVAVYGSIAGHRSDAKSTLVQTPICKELLSRGYELKYGAPVMKGWRVKRNALKDMLQPVANIDPAKLDAIAEQLADEIMERLPVGWQEILGVVSEDVAVNGIPGVPHMERINVGTSAGFPYNKSKKHFVVPLDPFKGLAGPISLDENIRADIAMVLLSYKEGKRSYPVFRCVLKDEARKFEKIRKELTRVFYAAPVGWSVVFRMYFLTFLRLFYTNHRAFEALPGIATNSFEWSAVAEDLFAHDHVMDMDYKSFDVQAIKAVVMHTVFRVIIKIMKTSGKYSEEDIQVIECINVDCSYALLDFFGDLMMVMGINPSGNPATVMFNCLANSILCRLAYWDLNPDKEIKSFRNYISLYTYGDDNGQGVTDRPWYNMRTISEALAQYGITVTDAEKSEVPKEYQDPAKLSLLKRRFVWSDTVGAWLAPLEISSIEKPLLVHTKSKTETQENQLIQSIGGAMREFFFHGREEFEKRRTELMDVVEKCGLQDYVVDSTFPTWEEELVRFWNTAEKRHFN
ncbi:hypothetical protein 1 [Wenzhou picorna-like virus 15]|uniref:hypothetical protein 1 n=1 Tax=Wenzhou picorna-like virus 15 TaxID=1923599 RepID=UPI00090B289A|nr:hypothetical protein 1 [Wenzhou picorna-like virus 15]APG78502.1 hypothetical protein 1 [Wenzhou picorna-like virus 15]